MKLLYFYNRPSGQKKGFGVHRLVTSKLLIDLVLFIIRSEIKFLVLESMMTSLVTIATKIKFIQIVKLYIIRKRMEHTLK